MFIDLEIADMSSAVAPMPLLIQISLCVCMYVARLECVTICNISPLSLLQESPFKCTGTVCTMTVMIVLFHVSFVVQHVTGAYSSNDVFRMVSDYVKRSRTQQFKQGEVPVLSLANHVQIVDAMHHKRLLIYLSTRIIPDNEERKLTQCGTGQCSSLIVRV